MASLGAAAEPAEFQRIGRLLGGAKTLGRPLASALDVHDVLAKGLPAEALSHLVGKLTAIQPDGSFERAIGMSVRTFQRRKKTASKPLSQEQSGRTWKFAEILAKATEVFGSQEEAEHWLERPAIGLDGRRPIDLLATPAGVALVESFLTKLEYGVYI